MPSTESNDPPSGHRPGVASSRLSKELRLEFEKSLLPRRVAQYRLAMIVAIFLYDSFLMLDYECLRPIFHLCVIVRVAINTPIALLFLIAIGRVGRRTREFIFAITPLPSMASLLYIYNNVSDWIVGAQAALLMMTMYSVTAMRPGFRSACASIPVLVLGDIFYLAQNPNLDLPRTILCASLIACTGILALLLCFQAEKQEMSHFLLELDIQSKNARLLKVNEELGRLSQTDPLTGIVNRRGFESHFQAAWSRCLARNNPITVLMIDLDHFKTINDIHGHDLGDHVLCRIASVIRENLRGEQDLLARYGGEEFIAMLPNRTHESALQIAERLAEAVRGTEMTGRNLEPVHVTISIGAATLTPRATVEPTTLLRAADEALYLAKASGRNRVCGAAA